MDKTKLPPQEKPPLFKTWKRLYALVFIQLVVLILLFHLFTRMFE